MKKHVLFVLPLALTATPALAQDATGTVTIDGSVASRCLFTTPSAVISLGELAVSGATTAAGRLDTSKVDDQSATLVGWCNNAAAGMSVEAFPLLNQLSAATGFTSRVDFTATANANGADANDNTLVAGAGTIANVGMFTGDVEVTLSGSSAPSDNLLVAGDYDGSVEVTLTPVFTPPV